MIFSHYSFLKRFLAPVLKNKVLLILGLIRTLFYGLQGGVYALMMKNAIDAVTKQDKNSFLLSVGVLAFFMFLNTIPNHFFRKNYEKIYRLMQSFLYDTYITKYFQLGNNITDSKGTGYFNNVIQKGGDNWASLLSNGISMRLQVLIRLITALVMVIIYTNRVGGIIIVSLFLISFLISHYGTKKMIPIRKEMREYFTEADRDIIRLIMSKFDVLSNNRILFEINKLGLLFDNIRARKYHESYLKIFTFDLQRSAIQLAQILLFIYIGFGVLNGKFEVGLLAMVRMLSNQINGTTQDLNDFINDFYARIIYVEKLRETFDDAPLIQGYDEGKEFVYKRGDIVLDTITYDYGKGEVLKKFSLSIQGGKKTALVGISGSGKSTLIKLIAGYIHPQSGTISVDKQQLPNSQNDDFVSLKSYYHHIGYLTQEPNVFDGTIYENLTYALPEGTVDDRIIHQVIESSQCQFIYDFPDGLETHIGEKGIKLSGGQRQRLAIAKIMLKNPQIILLDEPTSALDSFSEEEVTKALENLFVGKTVIVIAHRLQTVKKADEIIVLEGGKVVEQGSHHQLVQLGGQYAKMLELQSGF